MPGFPHSLTVEVAFNDPAFTVAPTWHDLSAHVGVVAVSTSRGRGKEAEAVPSGTCRVIVDDPGMILDPGNTASPFAGKVRTMRQIRVTAQQTAFTTPVRLFTGYLDRIGRRWPGGGAMSQVTLDATDLFKVMAKRTLPSIAFAQSTSAARINALYGQLGAFPGVPAGQFNTPGYADYTLVSADYAEQNGLDAIMEAAQSDGGLFYIAGDGTPTYQSHGFRLSDVRATTSRATFGNSPGAIEVEDDLEPYIDDETTANTVTITAGDGQVLAVSYGPGLDQDGPLEFDLGSTLLVPLDADARAADIAARRGEARVSYDSVTLDAVSGDDQMTQALAREISDRITVAITPQGGGVATSRAQFIESVSHDIAVPDRWSTTFAISAV